MGLYSSPGVLVSIVRQLAGADFEREPEGAQASLALLAVLAKAGRTEALGLPPALPAAVTAKGAGQQQVSRSSLGMRLLSFGRKSMALYC